MLVIIVINILKINIKVIIKYYLKIIKIINKDPIIKIKINKIIKELDKIKILIDNKIEIISFKGKE